jgi:WD40 repeat protein
VIPYSVIEQCIFPFISDRVTWNNLSVVNKQFHEASKSILPPWPTTSFNVGRQVTSMSFSPCGTLLAVATDYDVIRIWNVRGKRVALVGHVASVRCLAFSFDSQYLISGGDDRVVRVWPTRDIERIGKPQLSTSVDHPPLSPSERLRGPPDLFTSGVELQNSSEVTCIASSPTSNIVAIGNKDGTVKVWRIEDCTCIGTLSLVGHLGHEPILSVSFPRRGGQECVAADSRTGFCRVWNLSDYSQCINLRFANRQVDLAADTSRKLILSDGGTRYAKVSYSASAISSIVLGELIGVNMGSVHTQIRTITAGFHASISSLFFSPGAIISNTNDATRGVQIFFLCNEKQELLVQSTVDDCMLDRGDAIMSVALTPPSSLTRTLALGSLDGIVRLRKATLVAAGMGDTQDR